MCVEYYEGCHLCYTSTRRLLVAILCPRMKARPENHCTNVMITKDNYLRCPGGSLRIPMKLVHHWDCPHCLQGYPVALRLRGPGLSFKTVTKDFSTYDLALFVRMVLGISIEAQATMLADTVEREYDPRRVTRSYFPRRIVVELPAGLGGNTGADGGDGLAGLMPLPKAEDSGTSVVMEEMYYSEPVIKPELHGSVIVVEDSELEPFTKMEVDESLLKVEESASSIKTEKVEDAEPYTKIEKMEDSGSSTKIEEVEDSGPSTKKRKWKTQNRQY